MKITTAVLIALMIAAPAVASKDPGPMGFGSKKLTPPPAVRYGLGQHIYDAITAYRAPAEPDTAPKTFPEKWAAAYAMPIAKPSPTGRVEGNRVVRDVRFVGHGAEEITYDIAHDSLIAMRAIGHDALIAPRHVVHGAENVMHKAEDLNPISLVKKTL